MGLEAAIRGAVAGSQGAGGPWLRPALLGPNPRWGLVPMGLATLAEARARDGGQWLAPEGFAATPRGLINPS